MMHQSFNFEGYIQMALAVERLKRREIANNEKNGYVLMNDKVITAFS